MRWIYKTPFWIALLILYIPNFLFTPFPDITSVSEPPVLESNPILLRSATKITPLNAAMLEKAGQLLFTPWELATALAWSPDGKVLAIAAGEEIYLFDIEDWSIKSHFYIGALTHSLAYSRDGNWLVSGSRDGLVRCWFQPQLTNPNITKVQATIIFEAHKKGVNDLAFSPDGMVLASGGNDAVARFWDLENRQVLGLMIGGTYAVPSIAFSPDGTALAVANGNMIRIRQVGTERILGSFMADGPLYSLAYSPDEAWIAAGDLQNQVLLWKPEQAFRTGQEEFPQPVRLSGHNGKIGTYQALIWEVAFHPDSQLLASAGGDGSVRLWEVNKELLIATLLGHTAAVTSVKFNLSFDALASSGLDGRVIIWKINNEK